MAAKLWVDVFRNLPLIFLILYLALSMPQGLRDLWRDHAPSFLPEAMQSERSGRILSNTAGNPFSGGGVDAPILHVMIFIGVLFVIVNYGLSRLSRRLEMKTAERTAVKVEPEPAPA